MIIISEIIKTRTISHTALTQFTVTGTSFLLGSLGVFYLIVTLFNLTLTLEVKVGLVTFLFALPAIGLVTLNRVEQTPKMRRILCFLATISILMALGTLYVITMH